MGKQHEHKTNAMRVLDAAGIPYTSRLFPCETALSGVEVARLLELDPARVFKTLVCVGKSGEHHVFMVPVAQELDTTVDETAQLFDRIAFSGGRLGCQLELSPADLGRVVPFSYADLTA